MRARSIICATVLSALVLLPTGSAWAAAADERPDHPWAARVRAATEYAKERRGNVSFAVTNEDGFLVGGHRTNDRKLAASMMKAMILTCYLRKPEVRRRALTKREKSLLDPMIRRSDDDAANALWGSTPTSCIRWLAKRSGMRRFETNSFWGRTKITAGGTARMFYEIDTLVPERHRGYARKLLRTVVPSQRWGLAKAVPTGFTILFKGGFYGGGGYRIENMGALYVKGDRRLSLAVLTNGNPSHQYGAATQRQIARILFRGYR